MLKKRSNEFKLIEKFFPKPNVTSYIWAFISIIFIIKICFYVHISIITLPLTSICLLMYIFIFKKNNYDIKMLSIKLDANIDGKSKDIECEINKKNDNKYYIFPVLFIIQLILVGNVGSYLLDRAMAMSSIKIKDSIIYIKKPYCQFIPDEYRMEDGNYAIDNFKRFNKINILFHGLGSKTVIEFKDNNNKDKTIVIPNSYIIIM